jgi:hypothetical protein
MPHSIRFLFAAALLASGVANAAPAAPAQAALRPTLEQISQLEGVYGLADGRRVRIVQADDRLYAELDKNRRLELFAAGPDTVASRDGALTVQYMPEGPTERIRIRHERYPASQQIGVYRVFGR